MLKIVYFLLLAAASAEDYKYHRVRRSRTAAVWLLGALQVWFEKDDRWVTLTLTCSCFLFLCLLYGGLKQLSIKKEIDLKLGGADVRLIPGMMLVQGWDIALLGVFIGLVFASVYYVICRKRKKDHPLVPWMSLGCLLAEAMSCLQISLLR